MPETTFWGIHAKGSKLESILLTHNQLAIGWDELGDVSSFAHDREATKARLAAAMPNEKPGAIPVYAGQIHRFVSELANGDIVVFRAKSDQMIHLGKVIGEYVHDPAGDPAHPNRRPVKWLKAVPITPVSQGALYELGSAMTFFQLRNYADEWAELLSGDLPATPPETDKTVADVSEATEQNTRDFIRKRLSKDLKGHPFAQFVGHLLQTMGYRTRVAPEGVDWGIDIVAHRDELGFEPPIIKVQVKSGDGSVGGPVVSELIGNLAAGEYGLLITLGSFTSQAKTKAKANTRLIDGDELLDLVLAHYEEFDSAYKSLIPLKHMYVPQPTTEE